MDKKNVAIFSWSQKIKDKLLANQVQSDLKKFFESNKERINKILYWAWTSWVMWTVLETAQNVWITIEWYSIERYRKYDEWNWINTTFYEDDDVRIKEFTKSGDVFLALPWAKGTIKEVLWVSDNILESWENKTIFVPSTFIALFNLFTDLKAQWMMYPDDMKVIKTIDQLGNLRI